MGCPRNRDAPLLPTILLNINEAGHLIREFHLSHQPKIDVLSADLLRGNRGDPVKNWILDGHNCRQLTYLIDHLYLISLLALMIMVGVLPPQVLNHILGIKALKVILDRLIEASHPIIEVAITFLALIGVSLVRPRMIAPSLLNEVEAISTAVWTLNLWGPEVGVKPTLKGLIRFRGLVAQCTSRFHMVTDEWLQMWAIAVHHFAPTKSHQSLKSGYRGMRPIMTRGRGCHRSRLRKMTRLTLQQNKGLNSALPLNQKLRLPQ